MKIGDMVTFDPDRLIKGPAIVWSSPHHNADYLCDFPSQSFATVLEINSEIKRNSALEIQVKLLLNCTQGWVNQKFLRVVA